MAEILHLYISPAHNYFGHHDQPPGEAPMVERESIECVAAHGIRNDRFFDYKENYKGQITFFEQEIYEDLCRTMDIHDKPPSVFRRNVIIAGVKLTDWYEKDFVVQGVQFHGTGECKPCYWMDHAFAPGAEQALQGRGGLRATIASDGILRKGAAP
jgi:MOSC domain-containing protein YiiM